MFAPTDDAFAKIPKDKLDALLKDKAALTKVLTYHVVPGKVMAKDVKAGPVKTVEGDSLTVAVNGGQVSVDNAKVVKTDVVADNGVIHVIDTVVMLSDTRLAGLRQPHGTIDWFIAPSPVRCDEPLFIFSPPWSARSAWRDGRADPQRQHRAGRLHQRAVLPVLQRA